MNPCASSALGTAGRTLWAVAGAILSLLTFFKPLAFLAAIFGLVLLQGVDLGAAITRMFEHWQTLLIPIALLVFVSYWCSVLLLSYQFIRGRRLSFSAGAIVAVIAILFLVIGQPWVDTGQPFVPGPEDLLHIAFILGLALYAVRFKDASR